jgi:hypothetical protein
MNHESVSARMHILREKALSIIERKLPELVEELRLKELELHTPRGRTQSMKTRTTRTVKFQIPGFPANHHPPRTAPSESPRLSARVFTFPEPSPPRCRNSRSVSIAARLKSPRTLALPSFNFPSGFRPSRSVPRQLVSVNGVWRLDNVIL